MSSAHYPARSTETCIDYTETDHSERLSHRYEPLEVTFDKAYKDAPTKLSVVAYEHQIADHLAEPFAETNFQIGTVHEDSAHFFLTTELYNVGSYEELVDILSTIAHYAWEHPGGCWLNVQTVESDHHSHVVATVIP